MVAIQWASEDRLPRVTMTLYGPTGSGKTHAAATFPAPLFIFPKNENSRETLRGLPIPYYEITSMAECREVLDQLMAWKKRGELAGISTVVFENLSHWSEIVEQEITGNGQKQMEWGKYGQHFTQLREVLWQLDKHVVLTALDKVKTDKNGQPIQAGLRVYGQVAETIPSSCDALGYCEQVQTPNGASWQVHFRKWGLMDARTRIRGMPEATFPNFNFAEHIAPYLST